jgi:predicted HicB family RNase H-like nuclease
MYIYRMKAKEAKKPVTIIIKPSVKEKAKKKAAKSNISFSQLIENLLFEYAE